MQKWEYTFVTCYRYDGKSTLSYKVFASYMENQKIEVKDNAPNYCNRLGEEGWELVGLTSRDSRNDDTMTLVFKRPKN